MKRLINKTKNKLRQVRHHRIRAKVSGSLQIPRLSVFRSLNSLDLQLIDDENGITLCSVNTKEIKEESHEDLSAKVAKAYLAGKLLAEKAKAKKIGKIVFDRGGYKYHGRVKAIADGARDGGLKF